MHEEKEIGPLLMVQYSGLSCWGSASWMVQLWHWSLISLTDLSVKFLLFQLQHSRHLGSFAFPEDYFHSILFLYVFGPGHNFYSSLVLPKIFWEAGALENLWVFFFLPVPGLGTLPGVQWCVTVPSKGWSDAVRPLTVLWLLCWLHSLFASYN